MFAILRDVWQTIPQLCLRVLKEFLDILQGQDPAGLKQEPPDITGTVLLCLLLLLLLLFSSSSFSSSLCCYSSPVALFKLLVDMVTRSTIGDEEEALARQLSSVASACLLSLVVALGDTEMMLEACATLLCVDPALSSTPVKVGRRSRCT